MKAISFKPRQTVKRLLSVLPDRARDILRKRFGLDGEERRTLEAIGKEYGITRERVRQIERFALDAIRKSDAYEKEREAFDQLRALIVSLGGLVAEDELLAHISKDKKTQNHIHFLLTLGDYFKKEKENEHFKHRWVVDEETAEKVYKALRKLYANLSDEDLLAEPDIVSSFLSHLENVAAEYKNEEIIKRWLSVSKTIDKNPLGEWGRASSNNVRVRGMRDYAYLVIRRHGNPMHFSEVARAIEKVFGKKAHTATCHNELIKDPRFVLVGRGLYALYDWGYASGVVRDVIREILKKEGPMTREEIIERVLRERYVKKNTIIVNLQNVEFFRRGRDGKYRAR